MPEPGGGRAPQAAWGWVRGVMCGAGEDAAERGGLFRCSLARRQGTGPLDPVPCCLPGLNYVPREGSPQGGPAPGVLLVSGGPRQREGPALLGDLCPCR